MGFHKSSMDIQLKNGHVLTAYCRRPSGDASYSELDLDEFLGTKKGEWGLAFSSLPDFLAFCTYHMYNSPSGLTRLCV